MAHRLPNFRIDSNSETVPSLDPSFSYLRNNTTPLTTSHEDSTASDEHDYTILKSEPNSTADEDISTHTHTTIVPALESQTSIPQKRDGLMIPQVDSPTAPNLIQYPAGHLQELLKNQEEKRKKLKRKAELARLSRRKKKQRMGDLEVQVEELKKKVKALESENTALRASVDAAPATKTNQAVQIKTEHGPDDSLQKLLGDLPTKPSSMADHVAKLSSAFKMRAEVAKASLQCLEESLAPSLPLQFLDWIMSQRDSFYEDSEGLFLSLFRDELKATSSQLKKLLEMRSTLSPEKPSPIPARSSVTHLLELLKNDKSMQQAQRFDEFCSIWKPLQVVEYIRWVQKFGQVCIKIKV